MTCKDCDGGNRPAPYPGPRCATHHREVKAVRRLAAQETRVLTVYNLSAEKYDAIYLVQGECCEICRRARGVRKRLSVDHDHSCCNGAYSCGNCVRGLLCTTCNKMLGHLRDDPDAFERASLYLRHWPSRRLSPV